MCMSAPKPPAPAPVPVPETPAPPPSPEQTAEAPVVDEGSKRTNTRGAEGNTSKRGAGSLRIDLNLAQPGGSGLNVPQG